MTKKFLPLLLVACLLVGCGPKDKRQVIRVSSFLGDPSLIKITNAVIADIEKRNPDLKIKLDVIPYNNYQNKITTELVGNNAPDVIFTEVGNFVDLYLRGAFEDLAPYMKRDGINLNDYYPDVLGRFSRDGHIVVLPQDTAPSGLVYYNKKAFDEAGIPYPKDDWRWPEPFLSICKKLVKKNAAGKIVRWGYSEEYPISFDNFMYSNGGSYVDDTNHPTRFTADSPAVMEAARFRWDLTHKYHVAPTTSEVQAFGFANSTQSMFLNGQVAMMVSGVWNVPTFLEKKDLEFDVVRFPMSPKGGKGWTTGGSGFAVCSQSKNKELAWKVAKELVSPSALSQLAATGMIQPALMRLSKSDVFLKAPGPAHKAILLDMPQYSHYSPFMANWSELMDSSYTNSMDRVWLGDKTPEEVLPVVTKNINEKYFSKKSENQ